MFRLFDTPPASGAWNMALDEALMRSVAVGERPVLRFYRWDPFCLSLGRNQPAAGRYDRNEIQRRGYDVVRRPTGGRAVLHGRELTYSVIVEERHLGGPRESYVAINRALISGLRELGVAAELQPATGARAHVPSTRPCFLHPVEGEVVVGARKLIGSAQYRHAGVVLQHGSLLLQNDQQILRELELCPLRATDAPPAVLSDHCVPLPSWEALTQALRRGWAATIGGLLETAEPSSAELEMTGTLQARHSHLEWIWRC